MTMENKDSTFDAELDKHLPTLREMLPQVMPNVFIATNEFRRLEEDRIT